MESLFITPNLNFEKTAGEVALPEDPNAWTAEILNEVHKQAPYVADFSPHVVMDKVDAEVGYGFGHVEVSNKTEMLTAQDPASLASSGVKTVRIPVVVKDGQLQPLDILVTADSRILPLTEPRLRQALFRPQNFDMTAKPFADSGLVNQLFPPHRQGFGMGGGAIEMGKAASGGRLLESILPTILEADFRNFEGSLTEQVKVAAAYNAGARRIFAALGEFQPVEKTASIKDHDTIQVTHTPSGYEVKIANSQEWAPESFMLDRGELVRLLGEKVALATDEAGSLTMGMGTSAEEAPAAEPAELVTQFGVYEVETESGEKLTGYVFPELIDVDGRKLPVALFTNGTHSAVQGEIMGSPRQGEESSLFEGRPGGKGVFFRGEEATIPYEIMGSDQEGLHAKTWDGRPVRLVQAAGVKEVSGVGGEDVVVPSDFRWMPLGQTESVVLVGGQAGGEVGKIAHANAAPNTVVIRSGGASFSLSGDPVEKIASRDFLSFDEALFALTGLGINPTVGTQKLADARYWSFPVEVQVHRQIQPASEKVASAGLSENALSFVQSLRCDLVKEAAAIPDPTAVDTVLSLGFINPENILTFVSYLPSIDMAQEKLCELLLAARLGLQQVPIGALEKAIRSVENAIEGLRVMAFSSVGQ